MDRYVRTATSSAPVRTPGIVGASLELIVGLAGIGTAIVRDPVVRRQDESRALGFVGSPWNASRHSGAESL
jgi:hypothetical protein